MTLWHAALVFVGGGAGALSRYLLDRTIQSRHRSDFPLGTLVVNLLGCALIGIVYGHSLRHGWNTTVSTLLAIGYCGGLTTFSTFAVESVHLLRHRRWQETVLYVGASCAVGIAAAALMYQI